MRKIFLPLIAILLAIGCKSKEEKANELINAELFKTLYDYESYQPIETIIDSAYSSIYRDSLIIDYAVKAKIYLELTNEYIEKTQNAKEIMEIWVSSYSTSYGRRRFQDANDEFSEYLELAQLNLDLTEAYKDSIKQAAETFQEQFIGWQAKHKFRCKTKGGNPDIADYIYIFDPDLKEILYSEDANDEDLLAIRKNIDEAINEDASE